MAATITKVDKALINKPNAILVAVVGSFFRRLNKPKKKTTKGVRAITKKGFIDWNNSVGSNQEGNYCRNYQNDTNFCRQ